MYPGFRAAEAEGMPLLWLRWTSRLKSKVHAAQFRAMLEKAQKRFAALARVEERHANHYKAQLALIIT